jgi:hypothetical protein
MLTAYHISELLADVISHYSQERNKDTQELRYKVAESHCVSVEWLSE